MSDFLSNLVSRSFRVPSIHAAASAGLALDAPDRAPFEDPFTERSVEGPETRVAEASVTAPSASVPIEQPALAASATVQPPIQRRASVAVPFPPPAIEPADSTRGGIHRTALSSIPRPPDSTASLAVYPSHISASPGTPSAPRAIVPAASPGGGSPQTVLPAAPVSSASRRGFTAAGSPQTVLPAAAASPAEQVARIISRPEEPGPPASAQPAVSLPAIERISTVTRESITAVVPRPTMNPPPSLSLIGRTMPVPQLPMRLPEVPPPETIVNVTIGRIEVRASQPAGKTEKPRHTPPLMGLDEYLRQRSGKR